VTESLARGAQAGLRIQRRWDPSVPLSRAGGAGRISTGARAAEIVTGASAPTTGSGPGETGTDVAFQTALGGLFFLVNVGLRLGLYGDFTTPSEPGISLDLWDFVELLGRGLLDRRLLDRRSRSDPVWDLLAGLSRRRGGPPGAGFEPPVDWRTPAGWLAPFDPSGRWIWSARRGRLRVEHPEGFVVLDVRRENQGSRESIDRELSTAGIRDVPLAPGRVTSLPGQALLRWVAILAGYVRARISLALGVPPVEAADLLLRRPARILVTPTHVDVAMSLAAHPIEIRLAGLDIEPGWIPAAGRFLSFHFD